MLLSFGVKNKTEFKISAQKTPLKQNKLISLKRMGNNLSLDERPATSQRDDGVLFVNEEKSFSTLTIDEGPVERPQSSASFDDAKRTLHKLVLRSSFRR